MFCNVDQSTAFVATEFTTAVARIYDRHLHEYGRDGFGPGRMHTGPVPIGAGPVLHRLRSGQNTPATLEPPQTQHEVAVDRLAWRAA